MREWEHLILSIKKELQSKKLSLHNEKILQEELILLFSMFNAQREYRLDNHNIVDFMIEGIAIEIKIKGGRKKIYRQCERYSLFDEVKAIVLLTNRSIGFPGEVNGKPCYVINLGLGWL